MLHKQIPPTIFIVNLKAAIAKADLNSVNHLLHEAVVNHYDINNVDPISKYTILHYAITKTNKNNQEEMLEILNAFIDVGADVNQPANDSFKNTPIHTACRRGLIDVVGCLMDHGADVNVKDKTNQTPLDYLNKIIDAKNLNVDEKVRQNLIRIRNKILTKVSENNTTFNKMAIYSFGFFAVIAIGGVVMLSADAGKGFNISDTLSQF